MFFASSSLSDSVSLDEEILILALTRREGALGLPLLAVRPEVFFFSLTARDDTDDLSGFIFIFGSLISPEGNCWKDHSLKEERRNY
jgi:hypothetical protein